MNATSLLAASAGSALLSSAALAAAAAQQPELQPINVIADRSFVNFAADLNQDGREDLIGGIPTFWMQSKADGGFAAPRPLTDQDVGAVYVEPADADGDGDLDLLAIRTFPAQLFLLKNDGRANFEVQPLPIQATSGVFQVIFKDMDGDGVPDIVVASGFTIDFYAGLGAGFFGSRVSTPAIGSPVTLHDVADEDGDGQLDLLLSAQRSTGQAIFWSRFVGAGTFDPGPTVESGLLTVLSAKAGDLDGTGGIDIALAEQDKISWYRSDASGGYQGPNLIASIIQPIDLRLKDVTGDQSLDLIYRSSTGPAGYGFYTNDGAGTFALGLGFDGSSGAQERVVPADVDGDGDQDLVLAVWKSNGPSEIQLAEATSPGSFAAPRSILAPIGTPTLPRVGHGDINGDGTLDLVIADDLDGVSAVKWLPGAGNGEARETLTLDTSTVTEKTFGMGTLVADFNGDGFDDIAVAGNPAILAPRELQVFDGAATGPAPGRVAATIVDGARLGLCRAVDVDQDGDLDIVCLSSQLAWLENNGQGAFGVSAPISIGPFNGGSIFESYIDVVDFNGDGIQDILI